MSDAEKAQTQISQQDLALQKEMFEQSKADTAQRQALMQPAIDFNKAITSGDKGSLMTAAAPYISQITGAGKKAREDIFESTSPGAARDVALADVAKSTRAGGASTINQLMLEAPDKLANIGSGIGSFALNEAGAAIQGGQGASAANQAIMQAESAKKASTMGFIGELAGAGGTALAGSKFF